MIGVIVGPETKQRFNQKARLEGMSMSQLAALLVEAYVETEMLPGQE